LLVLIVHAFISLHTFIHFYGQGKILVYLILLILVTSAKVMTSMTLGHVPG